MENLFKIILLKERIVLDAAATAVIYVNSHAAAGGDGTSWAHAYNNVQDALVKAASTPGADQVWIAQGTYKPSQIYSPNGVTGGASGLNDPHLKTFNLPNNVSIYGGFNGTETLLSQANPTPNPTILSGDLLGNDINNTSNPGYLASKADNVWHVVTAGNDITQTGVNAKLNGLTITGGFAAGPDAAFPAHGPNFSTLFGYTHESGGGIFERWGSNLTLNNDLLTNNAAGYFVQNATDPEVGGGAIFAMDVGTKLNIYSSVLSNNSTDPVQIRNGGAKETFLGVSLNLTNSVLSNNTGIRHGGAVAMFEAGQSTISHDTFSNNIVYSENTTDESFGGALFVGNTEPGAAVTIDSSTFLNNVAMPGGPGALAVAGALGLERIAAHSIDGAPLLLSVVVSNSTFMNNHSDFGGAIELTESGSGTGALVTFKGDTFIGNQAIAQGGAIENNGMNVNIDKSVFINNTSQ